MKKMLMMCAVALAAMGAFASDPKPEGGPYAETVEGVEWTFMVDANLNASVGTRSATAVPQSTIGAITIPIQLGGRTVTSIGTSAFSSCNGLTSVIIPDGVTTIGAGAFAYCKALTHMEIPMGVTVINASTFYDCQALSSVTIPEGVVSVSEYAFGNCIVLGDVDMPSTLREIGEDAFSACHGLTSVMIPSNVMDIGDRAFGLCGGVTNVTMAHGVESVGREAFWSCVNLKSVDIPSSVTNIGSRAFASCSSLSNVTIPSSVISIGTEAFSFCGNLIRIEVDADNRHYSSGEGVLFSKDKSLLIQYPAGREGEYVMPTGVLSIGNGAFYLCSGLTSVTIPDGVTSIGVDAFAGCRGLLSVSIPSSATSIGNGAFSHCDGIREATVPGWRCEVPFGVVTNLVISSGTVDIRSEAYLNCEAVEHVAIPSSVTRIGTRAFSGCTGLGEGLVIADGCVLALNGACPDHIVLTEDVRLIADGVFQGCDIDTIEISSKMNRVGRDAFAGANLNLAIFEGAPPSGMTDAGIKCDTPIKYNGHYALEWASVIQECKFTNAKSYTPIPAIKTLVFDKVGAFHSNLDNYQVVTGMPCRAEQPLFCDQWGVQAELLEMGSSGQIDKSYTPRVRLHWYIGLEPWGYVKWKGVESGSAYLSQATGSNNVYRSGKEGGIIPVQITSGTVVQYSLEVEYKVIVSDAEGQAIMMVTNWLDMTSWKCPEWYAPVDYNFDASINPSANFSAFTILDNISPGDAWVDEVNVFGEYDKYYDNSEKGLQYVEVNAPAKADMSGWRIRFLDALSGYSVITNDVACFGTGTLSGIKSRNIVSNRVFHCIGNKESDTMKKADGTLDGIWTFSQQSSTFGYDKVKDFYYVYDQMPFGVQLVRPSGVIEHSVVVVGTNRWGRVGVPSYDPTNIVAKLNSAVPGSRFDYAGEDCRGAFRAVCVVRGNDALSVAWTNDWVTTPGRINVHELPKSPVISPVSGTVFDTSLTVSMSCETEGATIHYTLDGSEPTMESPAYVKKFRIYERTVVKAIAFFESGTASKTAVAEYALGRCDDPVIMPPDGSVFEHSGQSVSIRRTAEDGVLRYTIDGSDPTAESPEYAGPFTIDESTVVKAKAFGDLYFDSNIVTATLTRVWVKLATPVITADETFTGTKNKVVMSCASEGATICYTLDGSEPTTSSLVYSKPFCVTEGCTIKAKAVQYDYLDSDVAEKEITREWGIGQTMGKPDHSFETSGDAGFVRVVDETAALGESMQSGEIKNSQTSILSTVVVGPGKLSFKWKTSCEDDPPLHEWDHAEFVLDSDILEVLDGETDWQSVSCDITGDGPHTVIWRYVKDGSEFEGEDCLWVSEYVWESDYTETQTTGVPVPYLWLEEKCSDVVDEFESYEKVAKQKALNKRLTVEQCYVAGVDPESLTQDFTTTITMEGGFPTVTWDPDLGVLREYKVWGRESLMSGDWQHPTNSTHHFFKVTVEMK